MKKFILMSLVAAFTFAGITSCSKYDDGPGVTFRSKKGRVANTWMVKSYEIDGTDVTSFVADAEFEFTKDGEFTFTFDGDSDTGDWEFTSSKEDIVLKYDDGSTDTWLITRLANDEFNFRIEEDGTVSKVELEEK